mgnify:CR=1 FL=1|tara:strand:+ start:1112 stop:1393 length:282 start_codon:yes stop_codon:yes gene_type:complete
MNSLSPKRLALALGITGVLFYLGCMLLMQLVDRETFMLLANSLCHGMDMGSIVRMDIPWWESALGMAGIFLLCWLFGYITAVLYNELFKSLNK